jgi:hypothetical protein
MAQRPNEREMLHLLSDIDVNKVRAKQGKYMPSYIPKRVEYAAKVAWFVDTEDIKRLMYMISRMSHIGSLIAHGYGAVGSWDYEVVEGDYSVFAGDVLMRPVPSTEAMRERAKGAVETFDACIPPYWHPQRSMKVLKPC